MALESFLNRASQGSVRGFDGGIGASSNGHANIRCSQRRSVVDAIVDHTHDLTSVFEFAYFIGFVLGKHLSQYMSDSNLF